MPVSAHRIKQLIIRRLQEELTPAEQQELSDWINASPFNKEIAEEFLDEKKLQQAVHDLYTSKEKVWQRLNEAIPGTKVVPMFRKTIFRWAAASVIIAIGVSSYFVIARRGTTKQSGSLATTHDVKAPQTNRATITTSEGKTIYLDSINNGTFATQNNVELIKTTDGAISYQRLKANSYQPIAVSYNTLTNPRGSKVQPLILTDGTQVWLNAESSITYPTAFVGNERKVTMTGEAYFEVKHNEKMPFTVSANGVDVHDLGTSFNVNAYNDEDAIRVTLLEGSVKVSSLTTHDSRLIKPGEQAIFTTHSLSRLGGNSRLTTNSSPDLDQVMAWKNGNFVFKSADIGTIMRQVARWYDVNVVYEGIPTGTFSGGVSRSANVSDVLKILELSDVKFKIEGKSITILH